MNSKTLVDKEPRAADPRVAWLDALQGYAGETPEVPETFAAPVRDICWSVDLMESRLMWINSGIEELFGHPAETLRAEPHLMWSRIHAADLDFLKSELLKTRGREPVGVKVRVNRHDGQIRRLLVRCVLVRSAAGEPLRLDGFFRDLTIDERRSEVLTLNDDRQAIDNGKGGKRISLRSNSDFENSIYNICVDATAELSARRVSVWNLDPSGERLELIDSHEASPEKLPLSKTLDAADYPSYFQFFNYSRLVDAADAWEDPRTRELADAHMRDTGFRARLDVAVMRKDKVVGLLSIEHHGEVRRWSEAEKAAAIAIADMLTFLWESRDREMAERDLILFKTIVDEANFGVTVMDLKGNIQYLNEAYAGMHGYYVEDVSGRHYSIFHSEEQALEIEGFRRELRDVGEYSGKEVWHRHRDGHEFPTLMHAKVIRDPDGSALFLFATAIDISESVSQRSELKVEKAKLSRLVASLPGMAFRIRNEPDWPVEMISEGSEKLTGWRPEELIDNAVIAHADVVHDDDRDRVWRLMREAIEENRAYEIEYRIVCKDGLTKKVWERGLGDYDENGVLLAIEGFVIDVSEKTRGMKEWSQDSDRMDIQGLVDNVQGKCI